MPLAGCLFLCAVLTSIPDFALPGRHAIDSLDVRVRNPVSHHSLPARLFLPTDSGSVPAVIMGHGYATDRTRLYSYGRHLASWGYVVLVNSYPGGLLPDHAAIVEDILFLKDWLCTQQGKPTSPLAGRIDTTRFVLGGHSLSGGLSVVAAARTTNVAALLLLAPGMVEGVKEALVRDSMPAIVFAATNDDITPPAEHARVIASGLPGQKCVAVIRGGTHNQFMDYARWYEDVLDGDPTISRTEQETIVRRYATLFLEGYVRSIEPARHILASLLPTDPYLEP